MNYFLLTQYDGRILGPIAKVLGLIMEGIFNLLDALNFPNIGVAIILFTIVINMILLPLTIKQQKFSKLSAKMNPELQAIRDKYKDRKDNDSVMAMNQETQAVYAKYGVSPTGSCVQLAIQMPILFALYRVIYAVPAYVSKVKDVFNGLADSLYTQNGIRDFIQTFKGASYYNKQFNNELFINNDPVFVKNTIIDCLNRASTAEWNDLADKFSSLSSQIVNTREQFDQFNNFLGLNIANSPSFTISAAISERNMLLVLGGILIPVLAALTQWINTKLMPQANNNNNSQDQMAQTMKSMNVMMPIMSAFFCYSLPIGMGLYWIAGAVIRSIQQIVINKQIDKMDIDAFIEKNSGKAQKKIEKQKKNAERVSNYASMNTRSISDKAKGNSNSNSNKLSEAEKRKLYEESLKKGKKSSQTGSIASKANMVKKFNDKNQ